MRGVCTTWCQNSRGLVVYESTTSPGGWLVVRQCVSGASVVPRWCVSGFRTEFGHTCLFGFVMFACLHVRHASRTIALLPDWGGHDAGHVAATPRFGVTVFRSVARAPRTRQNAECMRGPSDATGSKLTYANSYISSLILCLSSPLILSDCLLLIFSTACSV
jgi:hypothetical protein